MYTKYCIRFFLISIIVCTVPMVSMNIASYSDVILKSPDSSKRFYITGGTAQHFGEIVNTIQQKKMGSIPEYIIDSPAFSYNTLHTLCTHIQQVHARQYKIDEINPEDMPNVLVLADKLGVAYKAMRMPDDTAYLVHHESEKPIKIPDVLACNYQKNFNSFIYRDPKPEYPLAAYQMLFDRYEQKSLDQKKLLNLMPSMCNIQDIIMGDDAPRQSRWLINAFIPELDSIIKNKEEPLSERIQAINHYTLLFDLMSEEEKKHIANKADDSTQKTYNVCDALYEMMYDTAISKDFAQLMTVSAPYIDEHDISEKRQNILKQNVRNNIDTIIEQLRTGLIQWSEKDSAAALFWEIAKYSDAIKARVNILLREACRKNYYFIENQPLLPTSFFILLDNITKQNTSNFEYINQLCIRGAHSTHIPLILAMTRAFVDIRQPLSFYYPNKTSIYHGFPLNYSEKFYTFLRIVPEVDIKALDTLYVAQEISLNIDAHTIVAPITLCRRPLDISVNELPKAWEQYVIHNTGEYYSRVLLPQDWRRRTITEWAVLLGSVFLIYKCILKPYDTYVRQPYVDHMQADQQCNFQVQMQKQVISQCTDVDTAALFFQKAHARMPFCDASKHVLNDILQRPTSTKTQFSYDAMKHIKQLINTTRAIEKETFVDIPLRWQDIFFCYVRSPLYGIIGFLIREIYILKSIQQCPYDNAIRFFDYKKYKFDIYGFLSRSVGLVYSLCGGNTAKWVQPMHKIHIRE